MIGLKMQRGFRFLSVIVLFAGLNACAGKNSAYTAKDLNEQLVLSTLWTQKAAEYRALCYQAYNIARLRLDQDLQNKKIKKKRAIIVDGDETTIQANTYEAYLIGSEKQYPEDWFKWVGEGIGKPVPGSLEFLQYASKKGVEIFYVTNRKVAHEYEGTVKNLKRFGFPNVDDEHFYLREKGQDSNKQARQDKIAEKYHLVLLVGDNLDDFSGDFYNKSSEERFTFTDKYRSQFGEKWIVTPNPMYGTWEKAIVEHKKDVSPEETNRMRKEALEKWKPSGD